MDIGSNIKKRRIELNISQEELAKKLNYKTRSSIAKIESGENEITFSKLEEIALALDTSVEGLIRNTFKQENNEYRNNDKKTVVILAGGKSTRNKQNIPNQFINVLEKPVIVYSMEAYQNHPSIENIYIVCLKGWENIVTSYCRQYGITKFKGIIPAGQTGILSVKNAVDFLGKQNCDDVIFQESTRPLITSEMISSLLAESIENKCVAMSNPMNDHLMYLKKDSSYETISRNNVIEAQSPEYYKLSYLIKAFYLADKDNHQYTETCCVQFMHNMGYKISFCEGNENNLKIIRQEDIVLFKYVLQNK